MASGNAYPLEGACQCGGVRYQILKPWHFVAACHCLECQKLSAAAFSLTMFLDTDAFRLLQGDLKRWDRVGASGATVAGYFCRDCGNRIYHQNPQTPQFLRLKPGTLNDTTVLEPDYHVWVKRKQPWVQIPDGVSQFDGQPASVQEIVAAVQSTRRRRGSA
jgi:hypothetical protein